MPTALEQFQWQRQPNADRFIRSLVDDFLANIPAAADVARRMKEETGTRFIDWVDHIAIPATMDNRRLLNEAGYVPEVLDLLLPGRTFVHPGGHFPAIVLDAERLIAIKAESTADFAAANGLPAPAGMPLDAYREREISRGESGRFIVVERHGWRGFHAPAMSAEQRVALLRHGETFRARPRRSEKDEAAGFEETTTMIDAAIADLGQDRACDLFFSAEREFWQRRNRAAQFQKARQDRLGLGWANHDHHTYRSSRRHFARLIRAFERLGLVCRERFYAGREAGWGAQVMEQPNAGIVVFADVDLSPEELFNDFAHDPLPPRDVLGTVGLWCGLHGESFLQAGMHHLECQFDFESLRQQLESAGVKVMKPFTDFPYLRQAFTEGERWPVDGRRIDALLTDKLITPEQAGHFRREGAIGSHLENLERNEGFKGFNQTGVSEIIAATDPRLHFKQSTYKPPGG
jgi:hypothetical protein